MRKVIELENLAFPITVEQHADKSFRVTYGAQTKDRLTYSEAVKEVGECLFHALACEGLLEND